MQIAPYLAVLAATAILLYIPDLFPRCSCCRSIKFRFLFRIHKVVGISPGYGGIRSVCRKCCNKYGITNFEDLDRFIAARRKIRLRSLEKDQS